LIGYGLAAIQLSVSFCSFRWQHDQLRLVINRVLRPAISQKAIVADEGGAGPSLTHLQTQQSGMDVADANAIEVS